jgi:hypothetical protein
MLRTVILWVCGLFASSVIGAMLVDYFYGQNIAIWGLLVGAAVFTCGRLWITQPRKS